MLKFISHFNRRRRPSILKALLQAYMRCLMKKRLIEFNSYVNADSVS